MSLSMLGFIDSTFATGVVTISKASGDYVDGEFVPSGSPVESQHLACKQTASAEEVQSLPDGGERYTDIARFFINDGSMHSVGGTITDHNAKEYRILSADCRPERNYCKLICGSKND